MEPVVSTAARLKYSRVSVQGYLLLGLAQVIEAKDGSDTVERALSTLLLRGDEPIFDSTVHMHVPVTRFVVTLYTGAHLRLFAYEAGLFEPTVFYLPLDLGQLCSRFELDLRDPPDAKDVGPCAILHLSEYAAQVSAELARYLFTWLARIQYVLTPFTPPVS